MGGVVITSKDYTPLKRLVEKGEYEKRYETVQLYKRLDVKGETFDRIMRDMQGVIPKEGINFDGSDGTNFPRISVILEKVEGGHKFLGIMVSREGWFEGKRDFHLPIKDPLATHVLIQMVIPPEEIKKELIEGLKKHVRGEVIAHET